MSCSGRFGRRPRACCSLWRCVGPGQALMTTALSLAFTVDGMPQTKGSWRPVHRRGQVKLVPDNDLEPGWASAVAWSAKVALKGAAFPAGARFEVKLEFCLTPPPNKRRTNQRDLDKLVRSVLDALTSIVWADDEQVDKLVVQKFVTAGDETPGVDVVIR